MSFSSIERLANSGCYLSWRQPLYFFPDLRQECPRRRRLPKDPRGRLLTSRRFSPPAIGFWYTQSASVRIDQRTQRPKGETPGMQRIRQNGQFRLRLGHCTRLVGLRRSLARNRFLNSMLSGTGQPTTRGPRGGLLGERGPTWAASRSVPLGLRYGCGGRRLASRPAAGA